MSGVLKSIFYVYHPIDNKTIIQTLIILFQKNVYTRNQKFKDRIKSVSLNANNRATIRNSVIKLVVS